MNTIGESVVRRRFVLAWLWWCVLCLAVGGSGAPAVEGPQGQGGNHSGAEGLAVLESAREIPVAYDVDVVVVGGSSGAVAAAVAAAESGVRVFLTAERPYLGYDICGYYRLWLEPGEKPTTRLARKVFADSRDRGLYLRGVQFKYEADMPSAEPHRDTTEPSLLCDGRWHNAATQSVQYNGDVTITVDLGQVRRMRRVHVLAYQRRSRQRGDDFEVERVTVSLSTDKQQWQKAAVMKNVRAGESLPEPWGPVKFSSPLSGAGRYVRLDVKKSADVQRVLLGEIIIEAEGTEGRRRDDRGLWQVVKPMQVKRVLDEALLDARVSFLYSCYATDVLVDGRGDIAGVVIANRSGRQAVRAKVVIDATERATVARLAGVKFQLYPAGVQQFRFVVVGGQQKTAEGLSARQIPVELSDRQGRSSAVIEYTVDVAMDDGSFASFARAEQIVRDRCWSRGVKDSSDLLFQVPPDPMIGRRRLAGDWPGAAAVELDVFRPAGVEHLYVLGGCADVSRRAAGELLRPVELMAVGERIGRAAAEQTHRIDRPSRVRVGRQGSRADALGQVREHLRGLRPGCNEAETVRCEAGPVPVWGRYDVVVVGGGTGGAPAGIAAARAGAKVLVIEYLHGLGGVGTMGLINKYYYGYIAGFTKEVDMGVAQLEGKDRLGGEWRIECKKEWYRRELRKAGADIWFGVLGCGAVVEDGYVKGVVVASPQGRAVVLAKVVIDATGNADIASAAGAQCIYTDGTGVAVQGAGLAPKALGAGYTNTDWTFIDDGDAVDVWRAFVLAKKKFAEAYDLSQLVDTRERRRIVGDFVLSPMDVCLGRTFADTIAVARSNFDTHGFTIHPIFMLRPPDRKTMLVNVPYRCLLPKNLEGILVTGLGVSAHRDAMPVIRMQADIQNQGYAAGVAAAMAAKQDRGLRQIDIRKLQRHLVAIGNLPSQVLEQTDSLPLPQERVAEAVKRLVNDFEGLEVVLAHVKQAVPLLRQAYSSAKQAQAKLVYAHVLGMLGDAAGVETLLAEVEQRPWDKGWNYTGMGQYGASLSSLDSLIIALGRTGDKRAVEVLVKKVRQLEADSEFSHCRAVALALESLGDERAAEALAELLSKPGMMGHAFTDISKAWRQTPPDRTDTTTRNASLKELLLARALYRCGDYQGLGERILRQYAQDLRAHYARHACAVLRTGRRR